MISFIVLSKTDWLEFYSMCNGTGVWAKHVRKERHETAYSLQN